jgi:hypothetical protein
MCPAGPTEGAEMCGGVGVAVGRGVGEGVGEGMGEAVGERVGNDVGEAVDLASPPLLAGEGPGVGAPPRTVSRTATRTKRTRASSIPFTSVDRDGIFSRLYVDLWARNSSQKVNALFSILWGDVGRNAIPTYFRPIFERPP